MRRLGSGSSSGRRRRTTSGRVRLRRRDLRRTLTDPTPTAGDQFGFAVPRSTATWSSDFFTGAPDAGAVYVIDAASGAVRGHCRSRRRRRRLLGAAPRSTRRRSMGAPFDGTMAPNPGAAYLSIARRRTCPGVHQPGAGGGRFGAAIRITASRAIVGRRSLVSTRPPRVASSCSTAPPAHSYFLLENPSPNAGDQLAPRSRPSATTLRSARRSTTAT